MTRQARRTALLFVFAVGLGVVVGYAVDRSSDDVDATSAASQTLQVSGPKDADGRPDEDVDLADIPTTQVPATTTSTTVAPVPEVVEVPVPIAFVAPPPDSMRSLELADGLDFLSSPSTCPLPLDTPRLLPNALREYRSGIHRGIDFMCDDRGFEATSVAEGRVVMAHDGFVDPSTPDRDRVLSIAGDLGRTPTWTLAMLYGRFVVIDHGAIPDVGHVVTIYAHLESIADDIVEGAAVAQHQLIGEIGNSGTSSGARGNAEGIHLHWEIYVDDIFLGAGLTEAETRAVYKELLG